MAPNPIANGRTARRTYLVAVGAGVTALAGCGGGGGGGNVAATVVLSEWEVFFSEDPVPTGEVTLKVQNDGENTHELTLVRSDRQSGQLPTDDQGRVREGEVNVVGQVEGIESGNSKNMDLQLEEASYVGFCNIDNHYEQGMHDSVDAQPE
jgi:uncharacterized cupredoxin-like copper-binding protein